MCINTIFPEGYEMKIDEESLNIKMIGEISFEKILYITIIINKCFKLKYMVGL